MIVITTKISAAFFFLLLLLVLLPDTIRAQPVPSPVTTTTASPTTMPNDAVVPVDVSFSSVQIVYQNVGVLSLEEITQLEDITEGWFDGFYNENVELVQNMESSMTIEDQEVLDGSNTITFMQQLKYDALPGADMPETILGRALLQRRCHWTVATTLAREHYCLCGCGLCQSPTVGSVTCSQSYYQSRLRHTAAIHYAQQQQ